MTMDVIKKGIVEVMKHKESILQEKDVNKALVEDQDNAVINETIPVSKHSMEPPIKDPPQSSCKGRAKVQRYKAPLKKGSN